MPYYQILILCLALSMNILAVCSCTGTRLPRLVGWKLALACLLLGYIQCLTVWIGDILSHLLRGIPLLRGSVPNRYGVSGGLFLLLAVSLLVPAVQNNPVLERRLYLDTGALLKTTASVAGLLSINSFFTGLGIGVVYDYGRELYLTLSILSVLSSLGGVLIGYFLGYEHKRKAFLIGGALYIAEAVAVILHIV